MNRLGFKEYYLQGGDWGSRIITNMAQMLPQWVAKGICAEKLPPVLTLPSGSMVLVLPSVCPASHPLLLCFLQGHPHPCAFSYIHMLCIDIGTVLTLPKFQCCLASLSLAVEVNSAAFWFETSRRQITILNQERDKFKNSGEKRKEGAQPFSSWTLPRSTGLSYLKCRVETDRKRNAILSVEDGITAHCVAFNGKRAPQPRLGQRTDKVGKLLKQLDCRLSS